VTVEDGIYFRRWKPLQPSEGTAPIARDAPERPASENLPESANPLDAADRTA
jgi:hypothetical protein